MNAHQVQTYVTERCPKFYTEKRRKGFMALGLVLCLILMVTVIGVIWTYQYQTVQNLDLEYAIRASIQGASVAGSGLGDDLSAIGSPITPENPRVFTNQKLDELLDLNTQRQRRNTQSDGTIDQNKKIRVTLVAKDGDQAVLQFEQSRDFGFFRGLFHGDPTVEHVKNRPFTQWYLIKLDGGTVVGYQKIYSGAIPTP